MRRVTPICDPHAWARPDDTFAHYICTIPGCDVVTTACVECGRPVDDGRALIVCGRCLERGRRLVLDVAEDLDRFPYTVLEVVGLRSASYDVAKTTTSDDDLRLPFGFDRFTEDPHDTRIAAAKRPETAVDILRSWAHAWATVRGEHVDDVGSWWDYLVDRTVWAIQNPVDSDWRQYVDEARQVRSTVRRILGITPVREGTPCPDCGARVVREWQPRADRTPTTESAPASRRRGLDVEGLADTVRCTRCNRSWDTPAHLHAAALAALPDLVRVKPAALLTFGQLVEALAGRVNRQTIATWIHRGWLRPVHGPWPRSETRVRRRKDGTTERLYRLLDAGYLACWLEAEREDTERTAERAGGRP